MFFFSFHKSIAHILTFVEYSYLIDTLFYYQCIVFLVWMGNENKEKKEKILGEKNYNINYIKTMEQNIEADGKKASFKKWTLYVYCNKT